LTVIASAGLSGLFAVFVRWQNDRTDLGVGVALTGVIVAGAGFTYATQLSPFVVCALIAALAVSLAPAGVRVSVQRALRRCGVPPAARGRGGLSSGPSCPACWRRKHSWCSPR